MWLSFILARDFLPAPPPQTSLSLPLVFNYTKLFFLYRLMLSTFSYIHHLRKREKIKSESDDLCNLKLIVYPDKLFLMSSPHRDIGKKKKKQKPWDMETNSRVRALTYGHMSTHQAINIVVLRSNYSIGTYDKQASETGKCDHLDMLALGILINELINSLRILSDRFRSALPHHRIYLSNRTSSVTCTGQGLWRHYRT